MAVSPITVATDGYLNSPLSVAVDGYLVIGVVGVLRGGSSAKSRRYVDPDAPRWEHPSVVRDKLKAQLEREDEEIVMVIIAATLGMLQ